MATSLTRFERTLLEAAIADGPEREVLKQQVAAATVVERDNTGHGLFVHLRIPDHVPRLSVAPPARQLSGGGAIQLTHPTLKLGAGTIVWVEDGKIDCIECFTYDETWPQDDALIHVRTAAVEGDSDAAG